jgi:hypothetical protein
MKRHAGDLHRLEFAATFLSGASTALRFQADIPGTGPASRRIPSDLFG